MLGKDEAAAETKTEESAPSLRNSGSQPSATETIAGTSVEEIHTAPMKSASCQEIMVSAPEQSVRKNGLSAATTAIILLLTIAVIAETAILLRQQQGHTNNENDSLSQQTDTVKASPISAGNYDSDAISSEPPTAAHGVASSDDDEAHSASEGE